MDRGAWWAAVHGVTKSWARLSDFTFTFHFHALEKEMATHSSVLVQYFGHLWEELTHLKRPWCWEILKVGGEGDDRGWGDWMASLTQWTSVWVDSRSW